MQNLKLRTLQTLLMVLIIIFSGCGDDENLAPEAAITIDLTTKGTIGEIITDSEGMSLYIFTRDVAGASACAGACLDNWPVFYVKDIATTAGLNTTDFANITRADGTKQTTYKGWPLYYFASDESEADVKGDAVGNIFYAAKPNYSLFIGQQSVEGASMNYLVDAEGNSLYYFANDEQNVSNCADGCATAWPVFEDDTELVIPSAFSSSQFGTITRTDGKSQITYAGKPLYFFAQDTQRGEIKGHTVANWGLSAVQL